MKRKNKAAAALGRIGGKARARALTDGQRKQIARQGGLAKARKAQQNGTNPTRAGLASERK